MTPAVTLLGRGATEYCRVAEKPRIRKMVYTTDDGQLLGLWTAIRLIGEVREIQDPMVQAKILTQAQILLTVFAVVLKPQPWGQASLVPLSKQPVPRCTCRREPSSTASCAAGRRPGCPDGPV